MHYLSKRKKHICSFLVISLLLSLFCKPCLTFCADEIEVRDTKENAAPISENTFSLSSTDDIIALSEKSIDETWTLGRVFNLTKDLDLQGSGFKPISIFAGVFHGNGHTISGLKLEGNDSNTGLFRTIAETGRVEGLQVEGNIAPDGSMRRIGGIAGTNRGSIVDCSFSGYILGAEETGGIAGWNTPSGNIMRCKNSSEIHGIRRTGGIAGFNEGNIWESENEGGINTGSKNAWELDDERDAAAAAQMPDGELDDNNENLDKLNPDSLDLKDGNILQRFDDEHRINYTGGITGASSGILADCQNHGVVGYSHVGFKTGGIVGYERGVLYGCSNTGAIFGRKDVGGIAGQLEPCVMNIYFPDALSDSSDELDRLVDLTNALHKAIGEEDDKAQVKIDQIRFTTDELRAKIDAYKVYYQCKNDSVEKDIRSRINEIREIVDSIELDRYDKDTKGALESLRDGIDDFGKLIDATENAASSGIDVDMTNYFSKLISILSGTNTQLDTLLSKAVKADKHGKSLEDKTERLKELSGGLYEFLWGCIDDYKKDIRITGDDINSSTDALAIGMDALSDSLKASDALLRKHLDGLTSQVRVLNTTLNRGFDEIQEEMDDIWNTKDVEDIFRDISDDANEELTRGLILRAENRGNIDSDINGGGIAGFMDIDDDIQSDFEVVSGGQLSLVHERTQKATILNCSNHGDVSVRNNYAGGIVGRAEMGAVISGNNYGCIEVREGNYAGGIAGKSAFVIRNSHSMGEIKGQDYIGGIAGYGKTVIGNASFATVSMDSGEHIGAVLGDLDSEGECQGNIYVDQGVPAINGVTEEKSAKPVTYHEFLDTPGIPKEFSNLKVTFQADGEVLKTLYVPYGSSVSEHEYPDKLPEDISYGYWETPELTNVTENVTVNLKYVDWVTTIASDEDPPVLMLTGKFFDGTALSYSNDGQVSGVNIPKGYSLKAAIGFNIESPYEEKGSIYRVRYLSPEENEQESVLLLQNGQAVPVDFRRDGKYLVFPMDSEGTFIVAKKHENRLPYVLSGAGAILLLILFALFKKKPRSKN